MASDDGDVARALATLRIAWGPRLDQLKAERTTWAAFLRLLSRYDGKALVAACESLALTRPTLYPDDNPIGLIAQEIGRLATAGDPEPQDVVDWCLSTIRAHGRLWAGEYPSPLHREIVREAGGWYDLCAGAEEKTERSLARAAKAVLRERKAKAEEAMRPELQREPEATALPEKPVSREEALANIARLRKALREKAEP